MSDFLQYLVPGLIDGSIYALIAVGLVLTYRTSGVFNFAHGSLAAVGAYLFYQFHVLDHMAWPLAATVTILVVAGIGGLVLERLSAWIADAPPVMVVVGTVGLFVFLDSLLTAKYGLDALTVPPFLPQTGFVVDGVTVSGADLITLGLVLATTGGLMMFLRRTRTGIAVGGVVDDPQLLSMCGIDPVTIRRYAWIAGSAFAGVSGVLLAPDYGAYTTFLIPLVITAYAAAALGLFSSFPLTVLGGLLIGVIVDVMPDLVLHVHNVEIQQLPDNMPFVILFGVMLLVPARKLSQLGESNVRRFPAIRELPRRIAAGSIGLAALGLVALPFVIDRADVDQYSAGLSYVVIFVSLALITWTSGQVSLCHIAYAALGATTFGHLFGNDHLPWIVAMLGAGLATLPAALIVSIPANRLSGIYVAIATFGFGILLQEVFYGADFMFGGQLYIAAPRPRSVLGIGVSSDIGYYFLVLVVTALCCAAALVVRRARIGRMLKALSDSPVALDAHGADTRVIRVSVFCISAFIAGIGGALLVGVAQGASGAPGQVFDYSNSLLLLAVLAFCGRRPLLSPFVAAFLFEVVKIYPGFDAGFLLRYQGVIFGLLAMAVAAGSARSLGWTTIRSWRPPRARSAWPIGSVTPGGPTPLIASSRPETS